MITISIGKKPYFLGRAAMLVAGFNSCFKGRIASGTSVSRGKAKKKIHITKYRQLDFLQNLQVHSLELTVRSLNLQRCP